MERIPELVRCYRDAGLLIDTNLLLLFFVGLAGRALIARHKRTPKFTPEDFDLLDDFASRFRTVVTTPHILTEVVNLAGQCPEPHRRAVFERMAELVPNFHELYVESSSIVGLGPFLWLGLTDVGIGKVASDRFLVLTDDNPLASHLATEGVDCLNYYHLRTEAIGL